MRTFTSSGDSHAGSTVPLRASVSQTRQFFGRAIVAQYFRRADADHSTHSHRAVLCSTTLPRPWSQLAVAGIRLSELVCVVGSPAIVGSSRGWESELVGVVDSAAVARTSWDCECELVGVVAYSVDVFGSSRGAQLSVPLLTGLGGF